MIERVMCAHWPFGGPPALDPQRPWVEAAGWPAFWLHHQAAPSEQNEPELIGYRCRFRLAQEALFTLHITADEQYRLFLDGEFCGVGPEAGDRENWFFESYRVRLPAGEHLLAAEVEAFGARRAASRVSTRPGFLCACEGTHAPQELVSGGRMSEWEFSRLPGVTSPPLADPALAADNWADMTGPGFSYHLAVFRCDWWNDEALDWQPPQRGFAGNAGMTLYPSASTPLLRPALLPPPMEEEHKTWTLCSVRSQAGDGVAAALPPLEAWHDWLRRGEALILPAGISCEAVFDSEDYLCAYSELLACGGRGSCVEIAWAESLRNTSGEKARQIRREGCFAGVRDRVLLAGGDTRLRLAPWRAGRFLQVRVNTADEPLTLRRLRVCNSVYGAPSVLAGASSPATSDEEFNRILAVCQRTARACRRDVFMDCPHYEQLQYVGDTRLQILLAYCLDPDYRPARRALSLIFASAHNPTGLPLGCHPGRNGGLLPPFALWLAPMVRDYALWRDDVPQVRQFLPALRSVNDWFLRHLDTCGLVRSPFGWNFLDAALGQIVPGGEEGGLSGPLNWQLVLALQNSAELEERFGEPECAARFRRHAAEISAAAQRLLRRGEGAFADTPTDEGRASEHGQILALLGGTLPPERARSLQQALAGGVPLRPTGGYFTHYLFEIFRLMRRPDLLWSRLEPWRWALREGFCTFPEHFSLQTRSDCHAWNAHPLFHFYATLLGIQPREWGFRSVRITPQPGPLTALCGTMRHPRGPLTVSLQRASPDLAADWRGEFILPPGLRGELCWQELRMPLVPGWQRFHLPGGAESVDSC